MKITADDFWKLLPWAIDRLAAYYRFEGSFAGWDIGPKSHIVSGRKHPATGEEIRWIIRSHPDRYVYDPIAVVVWLLTGDYVGVSQKNRGDRIGLDRRFANRIEAASLQTPGYSRAIRRKLLGACKISLVYLEPTTR